MDEILLLQEIEEENRRAKRALRLQRKQLRDSQNAFELPENEFLRTYRLSKEATRHFIDLLLPFMTEQRRNTAIPLHIQILATVNLLATGSYQRIVGNSYLTCMSQSSISNSLHNTLRAANRIMNDFVIFPQTPAQMEIIKARFFERHHFPNVIGVVDGTQIAIHSPPNVIEEVFFNRKRYHSLNVMVVAGPQNEILYVNPLFGGRAHDSRVYRNSQLEEFLSNSYRRGLRNAWLIGDSAYRLSPTLMTPVMNPPRNSPAALYNEAFVHCRSVVERTIGILKGVFRCLLRERTLHYSPQIADIVNLCCTLHNIRIRFRVVDPVVIQFQHDEEDEDEELSDEEINEEGVVVRQNIIDTYFTN